MSEQARQTHLAIKHLGLFNAFFNSGVLFNSIVFRIVVGVLGVIPPESVAIVTMLEYTLNCVLEVPLGYFADRYGRVKSAIAGLLLIMLGLTSIYLALIIPHKSVKIALIFLDGILLGVGKPLMSGSVEAFYQDTILRLAKGSPELELAASRSFTRSQTFGKHFPLVATVVALPTLYTLNQSFGAEHAFLIGIAIYAFVIVRLSLDYRLFGEPHIPPAFRDTRSMVSVLIDNTRAREATLIRSVFQLINTVISGYLVISILRHAELQDPAYFWPLLLAFSLATALSASLRGYLLSGLLERLGESRFLTTFFAVHILTALILFGRFQSGTLLTFTIGVFFYILFFYVSQGALRAVSTNMISSTVDPQHQATAISLANMPGFLLVGIYGLYLTLLRSGAPTIPEAFVTVIVFGAIGVVSVLATRRQI